MPRPYIAAVVILLSGALPEALSGSPQDALYDADHRPGLSELATPDSTLGTAVGQVGSQGSPIPFAQISVKGLGRVLEADAEGHFLLDELAPGSHVLLVTAMGYETLERNFEVQPGTCTFLDLELRPSAVQMNPIVVTGTMRETFVSESPVKVDVVNVRFLQRKESRTHCNGCARATTAVPPDPSLSSANGRVLFPDRVPAQLGLRECGRAGRRGEAVHGCSFLDGRGR